MARKSNFLSLYVTNNVKLLWIIGLGVEKTTDLPNFRPKCPENRFMGGFFKDHNIVDWRILSHIMAAF